MNFFWKCLSLSALLAISSLTPASAGSLPTVGSSLDLNIEVFERNQERVLLRTLISRSNKPVNVVFVYGGGGFGHARTEDRGGLWCSDSFEDLHILRSLHSDYGDRIGIIPIAIPPAHHTKLLGLTEGIFLQPNWEDRGFVSATQAFVESTLSAQEAGTIPVPTYFDLEFNLIASPEVLDARKKFLPWHGVFRAAGETQQYGVPSLWLVDANGVLLHAPFRGNVYHDHGDGISIAYTLEDVEAEVEAALKTQ